MSLSILPRASQLPAAESQAATRHQIHYTDVRRRRLEAQPHTFFAVNFLVKAMSFKQTSAKVDAELANFKRVRNAFEGIRERALDIDQVKSIRLIPQENEGCLSVSDMGEVTYTGMHSAF